jgi:hypothetical protein
MPDNAMEHISGELRTRGAEWFPELGEPRAVRIVGHTPKTDHYIYDLVVDFPEGCERLAAKLYRVGKGGPTVAHHRAAAENAALRSMWGVASASKLQGIPRPIGDFSAVGAVVSMKLGGIPLQSIIMKAALLPGYAGLGLLQNAARSAGGWLRAFQRVTVQPSKPLDADGLQAELERLCHSCKGEGLDDASIRKILSSSRAILSRARRPLSNAALLHEFTPLNVVVSERGVGFSEFSRMEEDGSAYSDPATFLACVEALEKYPFCNRTITNEVQESFLDAYDATEQEREILNVVKMKVLLSMFAAGRTVKESALRKKVMWANVMKKFIQTAANRSLPKAA